ncbi:uncharacterized protein CELE_R05G9.5 [Caenorhabditis elegans]|uniref:Uncharacterized protein n=1 Tax=Caenorhabditis elegans TaxID=6239 RepID=G4SPD7_CAEEL|nr:Uncharacterized protein CELE_R05G9.5 [Caenorhabditis elegans]CCD73234.1 Uncharacterized protein CELE_R05G9.5 [Caenorhabditis elegans]|eukprot:NP_001254117.1 Uncharacterized protein CELE_R05G9.5 [Caenorhabditis elegans]
MFSSLVLFVSFFYTIYCSEQISNASEITEIVRYDGRRIPFENRQQVFHYVNITNPAVEIKLKCAHCNAERCRPLPFCYSIMYSEEDVRSTGDYCADEAEMNSLVGAQLDATTSSQRKRRRLHESCLPSINDPTIQYCVCHTFDDDASSREYDALRRIRIWRYQSLIFHDEVQKSSCELRVTAVTLVLVLIW